MSSVLGCLGRWKARRPGSADKGTTASAGDLSARSANPSGERVRGPIVRVPNRAKRASISPRSKNRGYADTGSAKLEAHEALQWVHGLRSTCHLPLASRPSIPAPAGWWPGLTWKPSAFPLRRGESRRWFAARAALIPGLAELPTLRAKRSRGPRRRTPRHQLGTSRFAHWRTTGAGALRRPPTASCKRVAKPRPRGRSMRCARRGRRGWWRGERVEEVSGGSNR
jgi:hypothetical protein